MPVDPNLIVGIANQFNAGRERGIRNSLLRDQLDKERQRNALLAQYTMDGPPEQREQALNALLQHDPQTAAVVQQIQTRRDAAILAAQEAARQREIEQATQQMNQAQFVLDSDSPALSLRLLDEDGTFTQQLAEQGLIEDPDNLTDDEARMVAQLALEAAAPIAGKGPTDLAGDRTAAVNTFDALTAAAGLKPGTPEYQRAAAVELGIASRAGQAKTTEIGGVPTLVAIERDGQTVLVPLSELGAEMSGRGAVKLAEAEGGRGRVLTPEGTFAAVPGSEAAIEEEARAKVEEGRRAQEQQRASVAATEIDKALELIRDTKGFPAAGVGDFIKAIPYTDANELASTLQSIQALVGFDELNKMRKESPTGGALGPITERELQFLQSVMGSLDQRSPQTLERSLLRLKDAFDIVVNKGLPKGMTAEKFLAGESSSAPSDDEIEALLKKYGG